MEFSRLLNAAKCGEEKALSELHRRYAPRVLARVRDRLVPLLRRRFDTHDLGQSVFVEVLRDLPRFEDRGERAFRNWLYLKAENKVRKKLRRQLDGNGRRRETHFGVSDEHLLTSPWAGPQTSAGAADERARLQEVMETLDESERAVLVLRGQHGLPYEEVARRMELSSADAARMRYVRALLALRERWPED